MDERFLQPPKTELIRKLATVIMGDEANAGGFDTESLEAIVNLQCIAKSLSAVFNARLSIHGLSEGKLACLLFIFFEDLQDHHAPSPSDVAEGIGVTRATITGLLDGLERDGYIERRRQSRDRRAVTVHVCDKSRELLKMLMPDHMKMIAGILAPLSADEKRQFITLLRKLDVPQTYQPE